MGAPISTPTAGGLALIRRVLLVLCIATAANTTANVVAYVANQDTHDSLCALRLDLERRVESQLRFLAEHPDGIPGIPAKTIRTGIDNQQRTISALHGLSCK